MRRVGATQAQIARAEGISQSRVSQILRPLGIPTPRDRRNEQIAAMAHEGATQATIAERVGISPQRVSVLLQPYSTRRHTRRSTRREWLTRAILALAEAEGGATVDGILAIAPTTTTRKSVHVILGELRRCREVERRGAKRYATYHTVDLYKIYNEIDQLPSPIRISDD